MQCNANGVKCETQNWVYDGVDLAWLEIKRISAIQNLGLAYLQ